MASTNTNTNAAPVATSPAHALWRIVVADYESAKAAEARVEAELDAASAEYRAAVPDRADEFMAYGLNRYNINIEGDRTKLVRSTEMSVAMVDYYGRSDLSAEDFANIARKATSLVDDFLAWQAADHEASERIYGDVEKRFDAACSLRGDAQDKLLTTPAPDAEALLFKLDLLAKIEREHDTDDADSVEAITADARRLLGSN